MRRTLQLSLKSFRVNSGLSLKEAAEKAEIPEKTLRLMEEDEERLKQADLEYIIKLCKLYSIKAEEIRL